MRDSVIFCKVDSYGFPHWNGVDFLRWKTLPTNWRFDTGTAHLWIYKTAWLVYHRNMLKKSAEEAQIPLLLLAGVAAAEVGGAPERFKSVGVLQVRQILETISRREDKALSNATSVGSIAIQLGVAASTMGIRPDKLTSFEQFQLSNCLLDNRFNIRVVAFHLRDLIMLSCPGKDTAHLTDEQIIIIGSRYNRGTQREIQSITDSISAPVGTKQREYSEYGRRIIEKKTAIMEIMRGG